MQDLLSGVLNILGEYDEAISIRHLFYRCANLSLIEKSEKAYNGLRAHLSKWRVEHLIPYTAFCDGTRYRSGYQNFNDLGEYLQHCASAYRLNLWKNTDRFVEVWVEKDAILTAVAPLASEWNLQTFVCRGDPSMSALAVAGHNFNLAWRDGYIPTVLYLGDYDESGLAIPKTIEENLARHHNCKIDLIRVGINKHHIAQFDMPTRPPKGDRRGESIEYAVDIDALKPCDLRVILAHEIESFIDPDELSRMRQVEFLERETLETINLENLLQ